MRRILIVFGLLFSVTASAATTEIQHVFGWVENATLEPMGARVKAKLDTGALTSSLHALNVERFEKDGEEWVRFKVKVEDQKDDEMVSETFERPVYRDLTVRGAGGRDSRPVVRRILRWVSNVARGRKDHRQTLTGIELVEGETIGSAPAFTPATKQRRK